MIIGNIIWAVSATLVAAFIPGLDLKVGIPLGMALGLPVSVAAAVAITGNIMQTHIALRAVQYLYDYCHAMPRPYAWLQRMEARVSRHSALIARFGWVGLAGFVILPIPGSGVWGGALLAHLIRLPQWGVWLGCSVGLAITGVIYALGMQGAFSLFGFLRGWYL